MFPRIAGQRLPPLSELRRWEFPSLRKILFLAALVTVWLIIPGRLYSETISGTIKDSSGAVIIDGRVEITGGGLKQPVVVNSDALGKFTSPDLVAGTYSLRITREGFDPLVKTVELRKAVELQFTLQIGTAQTNITVASKSGKYANSDPVYRQLREIGLGLTFRVENFTLSWDVGTFQFRKGTITFLSPVQGVSTGAIFMGDGHFTLKPFTAPDIRELNRRTGADEVSEDFTQAIFRFTGGAHSNFLPGLGDKVDAPTEAAAFSQWQDRIRHRHEDGRGFTDGLLQGETMDNVDADLLAAADNPSHPPFFNAYFRGKKHKDLRYFVRSLVGAVPHRIWSTSRFSPTRTPPTLVHQVSKPARPGTPRGQSRGTS